MNMPRHPRPRPPLLALLVSGALLIVTAGGALAGPSGRAAKPAGHAAASYLTGIGDEQTEMFKIGRAPCRERV